ncbi:hypothetical protein SAMN05444421_107169 [Celeribacter marinus]|nr:hypothetical protein SAMN05444421_107169 [Celeribacter marinus]
MKKVNVGVTAAHLSEAGVVTVGSQSTGSGRWPKYVAECGHSRRLAPMTGLQDKADPTTNATASSAAPCQNQVWQLNRQLPSPSTG